MPMLSFALVRRNLGTLGLSGLILLAVAYYTFQVLPAKTSLLQSRYYRVLARIGANLNQQLDAQRKTNEGIKWRLRKEASAIRHAADAETYVQTHWKKFSPTWPRPAFAGLKPVDTEAAGPPQWNVSAGQLLFQDTVRLAGRPQKTYRLQWSVPLDSVAAPLARPDAFTYFFLLDAQRYRTLYASVPAALLLDKPSFKHPLAWVRDTSGLYTGTWAPVVLQGKEHYLFVVPQQVGESLWLLGGAVPKDSFDAARQAVSGRTVELGLLLILLGMLSLPFLKIAFMGPQERLGRADVLRLGGALVFGTGLMLVGIQSLAVRHWLEDDLTRQQLEALADEVGGRLGREVRELSTTLQATDARLAAPQDTGLVALPKDSLRYSPLDTPSLALPASARQQLSRQRDSSDIVAWLDRNGQARWVVGRKKIDYLTPLNGRDYFQAIRAHPGQYAPRATTAAATFLGSVVSYRTAQPTAVLARGSRLRLGQARGPAVCFLSTDLLCLRRPVLPPGFSFCLINARGEVLFHSSPRLSLNENLLADCQPAGELRAAIFARRRQGYEAYYQGRDSRLFIQPVAVAQPGLFVVAIADGSYLRTWQLQTGLAALRLLLGFWLGLGLLGLAWYALAAPSALSARIQHSFPRLWPRPAYRRRYAYIAGAHLVGIVALEVATRHLSLPGQLLALLLLPTWFFGLTAVLLRVRADGPLKWRSRFILMSALVVLNTVAYKFLDGSDIGPLLGLQAVLLLVIGGGLALQSQAAFLKALSAQRAKSLSVFATPHPHTYQFTYPAMLLTWLALLGLVPAIHCYQLANYCERTVQITQAHLVLLRQLEASRATATDSAGYAAQRLPFDTANHYLRFYAGTHWARYPLALRQQKSRAAKGIANNLTFCQWLHRDIDDHNRSQLLPLPFGFSGGSALAGTASAGQPPASAEPADWGMTTQAGPHTTTYTSQHPHHDYGLRSEADALVSGLALFGATGNKSADYLTLFGLLPLSLGTLIVLLGVLLHYLMRRCFMPAYHAHTYPPPESVVGAGAAAPACCHRFILLPATSTLAGLPAAMQAALTGALVLNARQLAQAAAWDKWLEEKLPPQKPPLGTVVFEELDFHAEDADLTECKRRVLEQLLGSSWCVVVLSRCHPLALVYCEHPLEPLCQVPGHVRQREAGTMLLDTLADFRAEYLPLSPAVAGVIAPALAPEQAAAARKLEQECQRLPFLQVHQSFLQELLKTHPPRKPNHATDQAVKLTQRLAQFHYRSLWRRLSPEEQFYLYDMAQDGLVNPHNHHVMETLLQKGYLRFDKHGRLLLFNDSFRQFALAALQQRRVVAYEAEQRQGSTWAAWQLPLLLLFLAGVVFVFVTQRAAMTGAEQLLTAFVTLLPLLGRLLSSLSSPSSQNKAEARA